jgi:anti-sigma B factor antagonist
MLSNGYQPIFLKYHPDRSLRSLSEEGEGWSSAEARGATKASQWGLCTHSIPLVRRSFVAIDSGSTTEDATEATLAAAQFELYDEARGTSHTLALIGELDMASAPALDQTLHRICTDTTGAVTLDLSRLTFMDSTGLRVMLMARDLCERHDCELQLIPGPAQIQRLFEVTGLLEQLPFRA